MNFERVSPKDQLIQWRRGKFFLLALFLVFILKSSSPSALKAQLLLPLKKETPSTQAIKGIASGDSQFNFALYDLDKRIDPAFESPAELLPRINFWLKIYTQLTSRDIVLFDEDHPEIQYETLDLRPLEAKSRNAIVFEILSERLIQSKIKEYKRAFAALHFNRARPTVVSDSVWNTVLSAKNRFPHEHSFKDMSQAFRTQLGQSDFVAEGITRFTPWEKTVERVFTSQGLPAQLTRISLVESSFNPIATSWAGARGVWQFMEATGREFLKLDFNIKLDERYSIYKSTFAAAKLFKRHRKILKDWPRTITSYNHGLRTFVKAKDGAHSSLFEECGHKSKLGFASRNYYPEFLAMLRAEQYKEFFFKNASPSTLTDLAHIEPVGHSLPRSYRFLDLLTQIEKSTTLTQDQIKELNLDLSKVKGKIPKNTVVVLTGDTLAFTDQLQTKRAAPIRMPKKKLKKPAKLLTAQNSERVRRAMN